MQCSKNIPNTEGGKSSMCLGTQTVGTLADPSENLVSGKVALVLNIQVSGNSLSSIPRQP